MPSFKYKTNKKIIVDDKSITTLDNRHREMQLYFSNVENVIIPSLLNEKKNIQKTLSQKHDYETDVNTIETSGIKNENKSKIPIEKQLEIKDRLAEIKTELRTHKNNIKQYYLNDNNVKKFLSNIDQSFINVNDFVFQTGTCQHCKSGELIPVEHEGILVCNNCSKYVVYLIENEKPSYKEPPKEACFYAYKRINHFKEIMAQFQAKETTQIPPEVIENIKLQIKKERISLSKFTNSKAKDILKKLGYNKFYEHIPFIKDKLGIKPPTMTPNLEELLCNLFMEIQGPYAKFCPDDRVNFLNYYYTIYKLCELIGQTQFLPYFPLLKDREKQIEQDEIWKKICFELNWEFIPTQ